MTAVSRRGLLLGGASLAAAGALGSSAPPPRRVAGRTAAHPISAARIHRWAATPGRAWSP